MRNYELRIMNYELKQGEIAAGAVRPRNDGGRI